MTTVVHAHDGPRRRPSDGRLGALAGVTPVAMFATWIAISGWGGSAGEFFLAAAEITLGAVVAGWIVGGHLGSSILGRLLGLVAYGLVAWLVLLPLNVLRSTLGDIQGGGASDPIAIFLAVGGYLLYGAISGLYAVVYLLPFAAAWLVTFLLLRRAFDR